MSTPEKIELVVSDDSTQRDGQKTVEELLSSWQGPTLYTHNQPSLGMAENWNNAIGLASGEYILILHDDDFLHDGSLSNILNYIDRLADKYPVLLFGVHVVNNKKSVLKKQVVRKKEHLAPVDAMFSLMSNSSFVRFPAIVIKNNLYKELGYFDPSVGYAADLDMWVRVFGKYGVVRLPVVTASYTVHESALTMNMFTIDVISKIVGIFDKVQETGLIEAGEIIKLKSLFFHQFILSGCFRHLRRGQVSAAAGVFKLFNYESIKILPPPAKWCWLRKLFSLILTRRIHG